MNRSLLRLAALTLFALPAASAIAQDGSFSWTGFYLGLGAGASFDATSTEYEHVGGSTLANGFLELGGQPCAGGTGCVILFDASQTSGLLTGYAGAQVQTGNFVFGFELDAHTGASGMANSLASPSGFGTDTLDIESSILWSGSARGNVGVVISDQVMAYATAGLAVGDVSTSVSRVCDGCLIGTSDFVASATNWGWAGGFGLDVALDENWRLKGQYLYLDLGSLSQSTVADASFAATNVTTDFRRHMVTVGISYLFTP